MAREFEEWQRRAAKLELIGANRLSRKIAFRAGGRDVVVLIDAVTADAKPADQYAIFVERRRSGERSQAVASRQTDASGLLEKQLRLNIEERSWIGSVDPGRIKRLREKSQGARRHRHR